MAPHVHMLLHQLAQVSPIYLCDFSLKIIPKKPLKFLKTKKILEKSYILNYKVLLVIFVEKFRK